MGTWINRIAFTKGENQCREFETKIAKLEEDHETEIQKLKRIHETEITKLEEAIAKLEGGSTTRLQLPPQCSQYMTMSSSTRKFSYLSTDERQCDKNSAAYLSDFSSEDWSGPGWYRVMGGAGTQLSTHAFTNATSGYCKTSL